MSELTTEQVKYCATDGYRGIEEDEFDAWLAQHDAEITKAAEARIIKLLEDTARTWRNLQYDNQADIFEHAIALIKEEQNA